MRKRLKHISELPDWFKLEKYTNAIKLTTQEWYIQLAIRKCYLESPNLDDFRDSILSVRKNPLVSIRDNLYLLSWVLSAAKVHISPFFPSATSLGVSPLTVRECYEMKNEINPKRKKSKPTAFLKKLDAQEEINYDDEEANKFFDYEFWLDSPLFQSSYPNSISEGVVSVNLNYTDEILVQHFQRWLSKVRLARQQEFKSKNYDQYDYNDWVQYGVLPYLDLKGWEMENNIQIPNRVMADAIYPRGEGGEETVRKTTKPLAESLLSQKLLAHLVGQITLEIPEQKPR